jgi:hypothetical protein
MKNRLAGSIVTLILMLGFSLEAFPQAYGAPGYAPGAWKPEELPKELSKPKPFEPHRLSGVWVYPGAGGHTLTDRPLKRPPGADPDPTADAFQPPAMTPWGQEKFDATKPQYGPRGLPPGLGEDPISTCDPLGYPHILWAAHQRPFEFMELPDRVLQHFQFHDTWRVIWTDERSLPKDPDPAWNGYSIGKWNGDTFVVDSTGYDDRTWLDHFGSPHSDRMVLQERYKRMDADTLELTMTLADPKTYLKPWVSDKLTFKNPKQALYEELCVPSEENSFNDNIRDPAVGKAKP